MRWWRGSLRWTTSTATWAHRCSCRQSRRSNARQSACELLHERAGPPQARISLEARSAERKFMSANVYIVDGARTPFLKARNKPGPFAASDLATAAGSALLLRQPFEAQQLDEVILGCAAPS